jgi:hypothetical protein
VYTDSSAATASVSRKLTRTAAAPVGSRKGFWRRYGKRRYPGQSGAAPAGSISTSASTEHNWTLWGRVYTVRTLHVYAATYSHYSLSLATTQSSIAELLLLFNHNILGCWTTT